MESDEEYAKRQKEFDELMFNTALEELEKDGFITFNPDGTYQATEKGIIEKKKLMFILISLPDKLKRRK